MHTRCLLLIIITQNGEPKAVLQDPKSYEDVKNALGILKLITQAEEQIKNNQVKTQDEVFKDLEKAFMKDEEKV